MYQSQGTCHIRVEDKMKSKELTNLDSREIVHYIKLASHQIEKLFVP